MRIGEAAARAGVTRKAVRYYESLGLINPARLSNGYRDYSELDVRRVHEVRLLNKLGVPVEQTGAFLECLAGGAEHGDDCPASLATYRDVIAELTDRIAALTAKRAVLINRLRSAADRTGRTGERDPMTDLTQLPADLPEPVDDGAADHLPGRPAPSVRLPGTDGQTVALDRLGPGRTVIYVYPLTGRPGVDLPAGWDDIPGARGCTTEACDFRDHHDELVAAGARRVFGLSSQDTDYQRELVARLRLPFPMLSDHALRLADLLPTFEAGGLTLYKRLTLVIADGAIEHVFYPVFPPNRHAAEVLTWLRAH
jgi:peroxiredoxin/DNA-binding transcriptional MerR regulator